MNILSKFIFSQIANNIWFRAFFLFLFLCVKALREREGIPDLRRAARYRYASVTLPEVVLILQCYLEI